MLSHSSLDHPQDERFKQQGHSRKSYHFHNRILPSQNSLALPTHPPQKAGWRERQGMEGLRGPIPTAPPAPFVHNFSEDELNHGMALFPC